MTPSAKRPPTPTGAVTSRSRRPQVPARGFSLVELLVAIGTVIFLAGITLTAVSAASRRMDVEATSNTIQLLDTAVREWEIAIGRQLTWGKKDDPYPGADYELHGYPDTPFDFVMTEVIEAIAGVPAADAVLAQIDDDAFYVYQAGAYPVWVSSPGEMTAQDDRFVGKRTILDAWGIPIYATHPGPLSLPNRECPYPSDCCNDDGTCFTYNEHIFGAARNRRMNFVSAGPDRQFGNLSRPPASTEYQWTLDNVFAYEIER